MRTKYRCPVCGFDALSEPPQNHAVCPSCGTEFDYDDLGLSHAELRKLWIAGGAHWFSPVNKPPQAWDAYAQLLRAGYLEVRRVQATTSATDAPVVAHSAVQVQFLFPARVNLRAESVKPSIGIDPKRPIITREMEYAN